MSGNSIFGTQVIWFCGERYEVSGRFLWFVLMVIEDIINPLTVLFGHKLDILCAGRWSFLNWVRVPSKALWWLHKIFRHHIQRRCYKS